MKLVTSLVLAMAVQIVTAQSNWELKKNRGGIKVYTRESADSPLDDFKGTTVVNASIDDIVQLFKSVGEMVEWVPDCTAAELIEAVGDRQIHYVAYAAPWPAADRDSFVQYIYNHSDSRNIKINFKALPDFGPQKDKFVRVPQMVGFWLLSYVSENETDVTYQVQADAGGAIPTWLANAAAVNTPFDNTLVLANG